jgi:glucosyl-dolichyl phosphate glucuronosyltransferase
MRSDQEARRRRGRSETIPSTEVSVVVCTYNRCQLLAKALDSIAQSKLPGAMSWEVVVVDNNSTDRTPETVRDLDRRYPGRFRYLFERRQGKSYALNAGISQAQGVILAFADDDTTVEPTWLGRLVAALDDPAWSGAGGPVILQWSCPRPSWLTTEDPMSAPLVGFNPDRKAGEIKEGLYGGNMAFRRSMFDKFGLFRTDLGPSPDRNTPRPNEDTEFVLRLLAAGERLYYEPSAVVFHPVPSNRLQKEYFLDWWFDKGRADMRMLGIPADVTWIVAGVPLYLIRRAIHWTARWAIALDSSKRFSNRLKVQWLLGGVVEARHQGRKAAALSTRDSVRRSVA